MNTQILGTVHKYMKYHYKKINCGYTLDTISKGVISMPRTARVKSPDSKYHIIIKSLREFDLFKKNEDKIKYLSLIKKYELKYGFKVYAYCLMSNHGHIIIDAAGADISKVMQGINLSYSYYFNKKYKRYGPVFHDRFNSKPVNNIRYMITLSAYIHNNPKDIARYKNKVKDYPFSSLKEYINRTDTFGILTRSFLEDLIGFQNKEGRKWYDNLIKESINENMEYEIEFINPETEYQPQKIILPRDFHPNKVIAYIAKLLGQHPGNIYLKYRRSSTKMRALTCLLMSYFCNMSHREICEVIGNITQSGVSYLISKGIEIITDDRSIVDNFLLQ